MKIMEVLQVSLSETKKQNNNQLKCAYKENMKMVLKTNQNRKLIKVIIEIFSSLFLIASLLNWKAILDRIWT